MVKAPIYLTGVPALDTWLKLPTRTDSGTQNNGSKAGSLLLQKTPGLSSWLSALALAGPSHYGHLKSEPADKLSSLSLN